MNPVKMANPINVAKCTFGLAGTAVGLAGTAGRSTAHVLLWGLHGLGELGKEGTGAVRQAAAGADGLVDDASIPGPTVVAAEPHAPEEPVVDVVGEALAAERAEGLVGAGLAHEPRAASRDEEHGGAPLQRAEADEIAEEATAALEGDVEPERHLTEPLLDPAEVKAVQAEMQTMRGAADPDKG